MLRVVLAAIVLAAAGCGDDDSGRAPVDAGATVRDSAPSPDTGAPIDAGGSPVDAGGDAGSATDTWDTFAMGFFETYCVGCHASGTRDYRTIDHVMRDSATIRCGVSPEALDGCGSFPPPAQFPVGTGPRPTDEERRRLVAWIDAGLL